MMNAKDKDPWYRHPWPWILMAGPAIAVVAGSITFYLAVVTNDGLVEEDYYAQGMRVNETSAREKNALALGVQADLMQSASEPAPASAVPTKLRVFLRANAGVSLPHALRLQIRHPTHAGTDQTVELRADAVGSSASYSGTLAHRLTGRWHLALEDADHKWRLTGDWTLEHDPVLHLPANRVADLPGS